MHYFYLSIKQKNIDQFYLVLTTQPYKPNVKKLQMFQTKVNTTNKVKEEIEKIIRHTIVSQKFINLLIKHENMIPGTLV